MSRVRLDQLLVDRGLARSRNEAQTLLMAGSVILPALGTRALKPGQLVSTEVELQLRSGRRWASRGGEKLEAALEAFAVDPAGTACLDAGASAGGFTDVLLARGARIVYAVDVGHGQLIDRLRRDSRIVVMERTNLRTLERLPEPMELVTLDLSFISLALVLRRVERLLAEQARVIALVKPQFEAGRRSVPRGGVVRDPAIHRAVLLEFGRSAGDVGLPPIGLIRSPITGADGNVEFLALLAPASSAPGLSAGSWEGAVGALLEASV